MDASPQTLVPDDFDFPEPLAPEPPTAASASVPTMAALHDIPVKVQAVLGGASMPIEDLLALRSGAVVELDRRVGEPIDVVVNGSLVARGELVLIDGSLGITLTEIVKQDR